MADAEAFALLTSLADFTDEPPPTIADDILRSYIVNAPAGDSRTGYEVNYDISDSIWSSRDAYPSTSASGICWDDIGHWPQRLLHVKSMTSYPWTPGNVYGGYKSPKYNAVSYTWGRYNIDQHSVQADNPLRPSKKTLRETRRMSIAGIEWGGALPRIDPKHYTLDEFRRLIKATTSRLGRKKVKDGDVEEGEGLGDEVHFLWLDLACIDQQNGPQKMEEIGRQAGIYRGAEDVFIWLTTTSEESLKKAMEDLGVCAERALEQPSDDLDSWLQHTPPEDQMSWLKTARSALDELFIDPWFTSVWTLQEGYLGPDAYLVSREATCPLIHVVPSDSSCSPAPVKATLGHLCRFASTLEKVCQHKFRAAKVYWERIRPSKPQCKRLKYLDEIPRMLDERGVMALASRNPIALLGASHYRKAMHDNDKVYGIQQIFNIRLSTGGGGHDGRKITKIALENQLGAEILESFPVLSQMHVYSMPVETGRGWRVSAASSVLHLDLRTELADLEFVVDCKLSTVNTARMQWGFFDGRICEFEHLAKAWADTKQSKRSLQQICLDALKKPATATMEYRVSVKSAQGGASFEPRYPRIWEFSWSISRDERQNDVAAWMLEHYPHVSPGKKLMVLLLGHFHDIHKAKKVTGDTTDDIYRAGLILVETEFNGQSYWKRLGFCIWECPQGPAFDGVFDDVLEAPSDSNSWTEAKGMFG